jgi:hypothetical protein
VSVGVDALVGVGEETEVPVTAGECVEESRGVEDLTPSSVGADEL